MSTDGNRPAEGPEDSAQFADLFGEGGTFAGEPEGGQEGQGQGEGQASEGETEAERQDRERDEQGRFAPRQERQGQGEDRAQRGLRKEVTTERGKRQEAETRAAALDRQMAEMRAQMDVLIRQGQGGQQQPHAQGQAESAKPDTPPKPDRWTDPDGYDKWMEDRAVERATAAFQQQAVQRADYSLESAKRRDPAGFDAAVATLRSLDPQANAQIRRQMLVVPDAGAFLLDFHKQEQARREIGADPNAYRERVRSEFAGNPTELLKDPAMRQAILDHLRAEAQQGGSNGGPRTTYTSIPSIGDARGSNLRRGDNNDASDAGIWDSTRG